MDRHHGLEVEIKDHVANDHSKNLREDIDEKHAEVIGLLQSHIQQTTQEFGHMRAEMGELRRNFEDERTRTRILEDAISGKAKTPRR